MGPSCYGSTHRSDGHPLYVHTTSRLLQEIQQHPINPTAPYNSIQETLTSVFSQQDNAYMLYMTCEIKIMFSISLSTPSKSIILKNILRHFDVFQKIVDMMQIFSS